MSTTARSGIVLPEIPERIDEHPRAPSLEGDEDRSEPLAGDCGARHQLRSAHRLRRWHVTFGNPALGTYAGRIVTLHPRRRRRQSPLARGGCDDIGSGSDDDDAYGDDSSDSDSTDDSFSSCSSFGSTQGDAADPDGSRTRRIVAMVNVPPHQVPDGVLNLVRGHRPFIEHVRIVIGSSRAEEAERRRRRRTRAKQRDCREEMRPESLRRSRSQTWACDGDAEGGGGLDDYLTTSSSAVSMGKSDENSSLYSSNRGRGSRSSSLDHSARLPYDNDIAGRNRDVDGTPDFGEEKKHEGDDNDDEDKSYHILFVLDSEDSAETFVSDLHHRPYTSLDESEICWVYHAGHVKGEDGVSLLGPFFASSSATSTSDNMPSSSAKEEHQCPVCLERMSIPSSRPLLAATTSDPSSSILTTVCNHSFHIDCLVRWQDSPCPVCRYDHSGLNETLSRCHVCATTVRNYVCLICGVISCSNGPMAPMCTYASSEGTEHITPQAPSHLGHALQHYQETLHAYALDTETQHVWDFAGGGYVHRLLQNSEDGKIVEGIDPRLMEEEQALNQLLGEEASSTPLSALERSAVPTYLSSAEDNEAMHRKLEGFAGQYYTLLKSQLEQQRIFYQGRLEAIRREHNNATRNERQSPSDLISALKQERNQLEQRCTTLRRKHKKVSDDAVFLENMNESLEADKHAFREQIARAQEELAEAKQLTQQLLTPLEEKVSLLMLQLENGVGRNAVDDRKPAAS